MDYLIIYTTTNDIDIAKNIAKHIVQEHLCACVNIIPQIYSIYNFNNQVIEDNELALLCKTTKNNEQDLIARIKELHNYELPAVFSIPITNGCPNYLQWLANQVK